MSGVDKGASEEKKLDQADQAKRKNIVVGRPSVIGDGLEISDEKRVYTTSEWHLQCSGLREQNDKPNNLESRESKVVVVKEEKGK